MNEVQWFFSRHLKKAKKRRRGKPSLHEPISAVLWVL
jgi:hypothetical protein